MAAAAGGGAGAPKKPTKKELRLQAKQAEEDRKQNVAAQEHPVLARLLEEILAARTDAKDEVVAVLDTSGSVSRYAVQHAYRHSAAEHTLDSAFGNMLLHTKPDNRTNQFQKMLYFVTTRSPNKFEIGALRKMTVTGKNTIVVVHCNAGVYGAITVKDRKVKLTTLNKPNGHKKEVTHLLNEIASKRSSAKARLQTTDTFIWCDPVKFLPIADAKAPDAGKVQDEVYMGVLYATLYLLWGPTSRKIEELGTKDVAAMLVDAQNRPIGFSFQVSRGDSIAHAETGLLLRYFSQHPTEQKLPAGTRMYSTLETCEMCRPLAASVAGAPFAEIFGEPDGAVKLCNADFDGNRYEPSKHTPTAAHIADSKCGVQHMTPGDPNPSFFTFCKNAFASVTAFLNNAGFKAAHPALTTNAAYLLDRVKEMRSTQWVGNPIFYDCEPDPMTHVAYW